MATFVQCLKYLSAFLVQMICWRSVNHFACRTYLEAFTRNFFVEERLKGVYHRLHRSQEAPRFQRIVEGAGGNVGSYNVRTDGIQCYVFFWKILPE